MDAGVAAVLGAAVGAFGTGAAALASGWLGARTAQQQIVAQHMQADQQRRFEHARDRREPRGQAYADLIAQTQKAGTLINVMNQVETYTTDSVREAMEQVTKLLRCRARVAVEGPVAVAGSAEDLADAATYCRDVLTALASLPGTPPEMQELSRTELVERCREGVEALAASLVVFVDDAREALDDNGAP
ncbi:MULTISPECIES: hypothetical protein [unclassified Streptomyces]|uniref:hypothetical protein n=1 Tax=unclassified Streptomyces TaxID=2593676 RepID=UPI002E80AFD6|nr:hypothetical protein [Streptomyces sp. NBC_00589]WTI42092.1 hypothetical protein OIC96_47660 [Streptomyces sp. NBC_00775]WUB24226.1 hypothetical protein OHA51_02055 [Streptomyces sp. NBC_00589]